jgi:CRISPR/Cas system-associated exonuclease Cas4 (RecB family)
MDLPKDYISYSQIRLYQSCPKKYYYTYVEKIPAPINDKIFLGIAFHATVEFYLAEKIKGTPPHRDFVMDYFNNYFEVNKKKQSITWEDSEKDTLKRGQGFVRYFMKDIVHNLRPMMVEKELLADIPGLDVKLKGVLDLVEEDFSITDFKTTTAKWSKARIRSSYLQIVIYRYLFEKNFGDVISQLRFKILYSKKTAHTRHQEVSIKPKDVDYDHEKMFDIIKYTVDGIRNEVFFKNESYACGFCPYKTVCKDVAPPAQAGEAPPAQEAV